MQGFKSPTAKTKKSFKRQIRISKRHERFYKNNFILFEIGYIFLAVPMLVIALSSVPILMFYTFVQKFHLWPIILVAILVVFFQITAIQYFVKRYYLEYHKLSLGQYLRTRYNNRRRRLIDEDQESSKVETWYDDMEEIIERIKCQRREQTMSIYTKVYTNILE
ncbi:MAG: hypothetical protein ACTSO7_04695 [Candidatus Heimdallarchaeota archaeon]